MLYDPYSVIPPLYSLLYNLFILKICLGNNLLLAS